MTTLRQNFSVSYSYTVHFTEDVFDLRNKTLAELVRAVQTPHKDFTSRVAFVVESEIARLKPQLETKIREYCQNLLPGTLSQSAILRVNGGESCKNDPQALQSLYDFLHGERICRHSYVVVIGGGALIDLVGYAAATTHRGVRLIRIPTTVLAQNDAGIGVKNSVNAFSKKNFLGTFAPAHAIINDFSFLETLPFRDWIAGVSEAIKVALIRDALFFDYIERHAKDFLNRDKRTMQYLIQRCAELHLDHIANGGDPFELGSSRPLDFGHWSAHKIESLSGHRIRHGEAVAIGIELDVTYSLLKGHLRKADFDRITTLFDVLGFSQWRRLLSLLSRDGVLEDALHEFKEHLGGTLHITLLNGIGEAFDVHEIDVQCMLAAINLINTIGVKSSARVKRRSLYYEGMPLQLSSVTISTEAQRKTNSV